MIMPAALKESAEVVIAIDTSGSISEADFSEFMSEVQSMHSLAPGTRMTVMTCDADVHEVIECDDFEQLKEQIKFKGGGGTDFRPVWKKVRELHPTAEYLVYFTDGYGEFPDVNDSGMDVLWVSTGEKFKVPFGDVVSMKGG